MSQNIDSIKFQAGKSPPIREIKRMELTLSPKEVLSKLPEGTKIIDLFLLLHKIKEHETVGKALEAIEKQEEKTLLSEGETRNFAKEWFKRHGKIY